MSLQGNFLLRVKFLLTLSLNSLQNCGEDNTCSTLVKVVSSGISDVPLANKWRARSRMLYSLSLTSPRITRYGSFGGICFQNSAAIKNSLHGHSRSIEIYSPNSLPIKISNVSVTYQYNVLHLSLRTYGVHEHEHVARQCNATQTTAKANKSSKLKAIS